MTPFILLIKPAGSDCNLDCAYCFYKNRTSQVGQGKQRMGDEVLEKFIRDYMELRFPATGLRQSSGTAKKIRHAESANK
jgi:sulfatase maturation enzyme AslB (radical SAM superfamily)